MNQSGTCDPLCSVDETSYKYFKANYQPKTDLLKAAAILEVTGTRALAINNSWVAENQVNLWHSESFHHSSWLLNELKFNEIGGWTGLICASEFRNGIAFWNWICWNNI